MGALEADEQVRVVIFDSAVDGYFLNHTDFLAKIEDLTSPLAAAPCPGCPDPSAETARSRSS
jgi:hypothetical protein